MSQDPHQEAHDLMTSAQAQAESGATGAALFDYRAALALWRRLDEPSPIATTLHQMGKLCIKREEFNTALDFLRQALGGYEALGKRTSAGEALVDIGEALLGDHRVGEAATHFMQAFKIHHDQGDTHQEARIAMRTAPILQRYGFIENALSTYNYALKIVKDMKDYRAEALILQRIAAISIRVERYQIAQHYYERLQAIAHKQKDEALEVHALLKMGLLYRQRQLDMLAHDSFAEALVVAKKAALPHEIMVAGALVGVMLQRSGEHAEALAFFQELLSIAQATDNTHYQSMALALLGEAQAESGAPQTALETLERGLAQTQHQDDLIGEATICSLIAHVLHEKLGRSREALDYLNTAIDIRRDDPSDPQLAADRRYQLQIQGHRRMPMGRLYRMRGSSKVGGG